MTRYEAAALLNACLDRITEVTDQLKRLMKEFEKQLAVLRGRVDGLEAKVGELEATRFSTTTKLSGQVTFVVGANTFSGSAINTGANTVNRAPNEFTGRPWTPVPLPNATTFTYDVQLTLDTSFTGKDLLRTNLRAGNFGESVLGGEAHALALAELEVAFEEDCGTETDCGDVVSIDKLFYPWPIGSGFTATLGARVGQEDMLALSPSVYPADTILNVMTVNGAPAAYSKNLGAGAGLWWQSNGFSISANYVAANGDSGNPSASVEDGGGGLGIRNSDATGSVQLGYPATVGPGCNLDLRATGDPVRPRNHPVHPQRHRSQYQCRHQCLGAERVLATAAQWLAAVPQPRLGRQYHHPQHPPTQRQPQDQPVLDGGSAVDGRLQERERLRLRSRPTRLCHSIHRWCDSQRWEPRVGVVVQVPGNRQHLDHPGPDLPESPPRPGDTFRRKLQPVR